MPGKQRASNERCVMLQIPHTIQVTSFGGSGTTMLLEFLRREGVNVSRDYDWGIWKHLPSPPNKNQYVIPDQFRAVYLFSDPAVALASVFERRLQKWHAIRMQSESLWPQGFEINNELTWSNWGMEDYLRINRDCFGLERQFVAWTTGSYRTHGYPIMLLKYEQLWENLTRLGDFVGLTQDQISRFPQKQERKTTASGSASVSDALRLLYADLRRAVAAHRDCAVI
jgi:hypothetical protein